MVAHVDVPARTDAEADDLCRFVDAAPSPYHTVAEVRRRLTAGGFVELAETDAWPGGAGRYLTVREGSLLAWVNPAGAAPHSPFRVVGGHTDSPGLRVKPRPDVSRLGWDQLGVEVYGGPLLTTWFDRDLGLSGRVVVRDAGAPGGYAQRLVRVDDPVLRVANLAIHLDRSAGDGATLNAQQHLAPIWGATTSAPDFRDYLGEQAQVEGSDVLGWDVMPHDLTPSARLGRTGDLIAAPRLDNLGTCHAGTRALLAVADVAADAPSAASTPVLVLFDHEEIGSTTNRGGFSQFLPAGLERIVLARGGGREDHLRALAASLVCSADMAHAVHPNYAERHEPQHQVRINGGPVLKVNSKGRYASDAPGEAAFALACAQAGVPMQAFVTRSDLPCGSTIGPMSAALSGAVTVDVGSPMLSMHSAREMCGALDPARYVAALAAVLAPAR